MFRQMYEEKYMRFPQGRTKALTFSYDDGVKADRRLLEVFKKYGFKGAFNLNSRLFDCKNWHGRMDEEETLRTFRGCGQEIALHGARHIFLDKVPLPEAVREIADNRAYLESRFGAIVRGMAYAYNGYNADVKRVLNDLGVAYARTTLSTRSFALPADWLELCPTCHHGDAALNNLTEKFVQDSPLNQFKHRESWLFLVWGHSYEFDDNGNWEIIETLGRTAGGREDVWYATPIEIYDYIQAYRSLVFSLDGERVYNPSCLPVWLELRGATYRIVGGAQVLFDAE